MDSLPRPIEIFFLPFVGGGHLIPMIDLARLFASHGVKSTIITFPNDVAVFQKSITRDHNSGHDINLIALQLPPGTSLSSVDMSASPLTDTSVLESPLKPLLESTRPDCIVHDSFHRWVADVIDEARIPRIIFNGSSCFAGCCQDSIQKYSPHTKVGSDSEPFILPGLPDEVELTILKLPVFMRTGNEFFAKSARSEQNSFGQIVNSFYELEPAYLDYYKNVMGKKAWFVGPVCLCNKNPEDKLERGQKADIDQHSCLSWLDSKESNSVVYISFGSLARISCAQIHEIACGLEASGHNLIWAIGKILDEDENGKSMFPDGFEERMEKGKRGLIIKGWAPQLLILEHEAVGGFLTHCGWNSTLEGVCTGVPMITWPLSAEQFSNENLVTEILKIGVRVGSEEWGSWNSERKTVIGREKVEDAVGRMMNGGEEAMEMRRRVKELAEKARKAVESGGSSFNDVYALIEELKTRRLAG